MQALNGMGGIGKTQTALEYAYRYRQDYEVILWANAHAREMLVADLAAIARVLNLPEKNAQNQGEAVSAVKRWFESNYGWLLILDNADELAMAREFIPSKETGHVLLTTRAQNTKPIAARQAVEKMNPREGALFLLLRLEKLKKGEILESAPEELRKQAEALSEAVDGLPLALDQAAAFIEEMPSTLEEYLALYKSARNEMLKRRGTLSSDHPSVTATFSLAFKKVEEANPAAADLLRVCAFLDADSIPEEVFSEGAKELGDAIGSIAESPLSLSDAIEEVGRFSLLRRHPEDRMLSLHRLVQAVLRDEMDSDTRRMWAERAVRAVNAIFPSVEFSNWEACNRLILHAQALAKSIEEYGFESEEAARLLNQGGYYLYERAQYAEVEALCQSALTIREKALGAEHSSVAISLNNLALLYHDQGKYEDAEPLYKQALSIHEKALGDGHPDVAQSLNNLARLYVHQGKYWEAEALHQRALAIREKALGPEHPGVAQSLNSLAWIYYHQRKYAEAERLFHRALVIREKALGPEHPDVAASLNNLGGIYYNQGKYAGVESLLKRALNITEKALGQEHPDVAGCLNGLALLYKNQEKYAEAEQFYQRALEIREKAQGPEHPDLAWPLNNLAQLLQATNRLSEAEPLFKRALEIREKALDKEHPDTATALNNLALLYNSQGKYAEAEPLLRRALAIREKALGEEHPDVATVLENYASLLRATDKESEAEKLGNRASIIRAKHSQPDSEGKNSE